MKIRHVIPVLAIVTVYTTGYVIAQSSKSSVEKDKPDYKWMISMRETAWNADGLVRTKQHALETGKLHMKYLFGHEGPFSVEEIGLYYVVYTKPPAKYVPGMKFHRYYVRINKGSGAVEEAGPFYNGDPFK
jgi:hypothetical protein